MGGAGHLVFEGLHLSGKPNGFHVVRPYIVSVLFSVSISCGIKFVSQKSSYLCILQIKISPIGLALLCEVNIF